jgi:septal ring factor EnvC (AmiA/AmiB activator)
MWPKLFAQLFELLPHVSRLIPMADRFFASRAATDRATEAAMTAMAEGVRGDLGQVTKAHAGLYRQLQEQGAQLDEVRDEIRRVRTALDQREHRIEVLESQVTSLGWWVKLGVSLVVVLLAVILWLLVRGH